MVRHMKFRREFIPLILSGRKRTTIRIKRKFEKGEKIYITDLNGRRYAEALIKDIVVKSFSELDDNDALNDGFLKVDELRSALIEIYGNIDDGRDVYIYHIEILRIIKNL